MRKFFRWLGSLFTKQVNEEVYHLKIVSELPENILDRTLYLEGDPSKEDYWYALLKCPCGCNERIMLNLMQDAEPCWEIRMDKNDFSIYPSVWRTKNCKSHFWLRNRKIIWTK
ncbi:hypothetical protein ATE84_1234 [Aquimarina sp. MAR_2010_214]|uniref:DUF6527 family protein n=1 Tax=Aquimarina sp. MAR_2010_214 TaxID=1250026 RepID=UPI000C70B271|nr:DUF6527 family protein [Aquimarina sp. MAR_2010_214]PKV49214.1 hypothetical protein ATE84_1234 [Aquimarina sp. MAR_2010_214]